VGGILFYGVPLYFSAPTQKQVLTLMPAEERRCGHIVVATAHRFGLFMFSTEKEFKEIVANC